MNHTDFPIPCFPVPKLADILTGVFEKILVVQGKTTLMQNFFLVLTHRPAEFRIFFTHHDALMLKETGSLRKADREMIVTKTSVENDCLYCVAANGALFTHFH